MALTGVWLRHIAHLAHAKLLPVHNPTAVKPNRAALPRRHPPVGPRPRGDNPPGGPRPEGPPLKVRIIGSEPMPESDFGQEL